MKYLLLVLLLTGCGGFSRSVASLTGYSEECVDGVAYLQFTSGVTVKYSQTGTVQRCK